MPPHADVLQWEHLPFPKSLRDFQRLFPDDDACARYLEGAKWPKGFVCPHCQVKGEPIRLSTRPGVLACRPCRKQTSLTVGTVMQRTHSPLTTWFWAEQALVCAAVEVRTRPAKKGDKPMRRGGRYAGRLRLEIVPNRTAKALCGFVEQAVEPGAMVITDAWQAYNSLSARGYQHLPVVESGNPEVAEEFLPIVHLVFSNLKAWLQGTHHGRVEAKHLQAYLNEFTFRFNRRFYPFNAFREGVEIESQRW